MDDINALKNGQHIVVGTPGRIYDMINRNVLILNNLKMLILDEADQMLDRGFKAQIYEIFNLGIPEETQIGLFSATWTPEADEIAKKFMRNPVVIKVQKDALTLDGIKQFKVDVKNEEYKYGVLVDLYRVISIKQAVIFCNLKKKIDEVAAKLKADNLSMICLHGEMEQKERDKIMKEFRNGTTRILLTTDLLARGIDIQQVSLVINYDIPNNKEMYIHRIGRSGRFGRKGVAINFVTDKEAPALADIESHYQTSISELPSDLDTVMNS
jgi:translation initiation factor 4A